MNAFKIAIITCLLVFGPSQVQFAQAGTWDEIKKTTKKLGQEIKKDSKTAGKEAQKAGKETKKETKKAYKDGKEALKEVAD